MDRRTKFILLILASLVLFGLVGWFIVWPTIKPVLPARTTSQPPSLPGSVTPNTGNLPTGSAPAGSQGGSAPAGSNIASFEPPPEPANPDAALIAELSRRAGVISERVESGSSQDGFSNLADAELDVSPALATKFRAMRSALQKAHPADGTSYVTTAQRLVSRGATDAVRGQTFNIIVQLRVVVRDGGTSSSVYREATVTFTKSGDTWIASNYEAKVFTP